MAAVSFFFIGVMVCLSKPEEEITCLELSARLLDELVFYEK
jgi:hypothetical protein